MESRSHERGEKVRKLGLAATGAGERQEVSPSTPSAALRGNNPGDCLISASQLPGCLE